MMLNVSPVSQMMMKNTDTPSDLPATKLSTTCQAVRRRERR
jgi:hypothetical protein